MNAITHTIHIIRTQMITIVNTKLLARKHNNDNMRKANNLNTDVKTTIGITLENKNNKGNGKHKHNNTNNDKRTTRT